MQAELFTSNCLIITALYAGKTKVYNILRILAMVLIANLIGSVFISYLTNVSGIFNEQTMGLVFEKAISKAHMPFDKLIFSSILCNIIVCTGMCMAYNTKNESAKIIVLWLAITVFVLSGTEHSCKYVLFIYRIFADC